MVKVATKYKKCFIAFLDILGFRSKVIESRDSADKLKILIDSLKICRRFTSGGKKATNSSGSDRTIDIRSRFFSDTIVFFLKENQEDIAQLFFMIRYLQDRLWEKKICLRGAITIGDMYWPNRKNNITVGPGLIEAYNLESEIAIYPRIVVSQELFEYFNHEEIQAYPFGQSGNLTDFIQRDDDGMYFLDLLNMDITRFEGERLQKFKDGDNAYFSIYLDDSCSSQYPSICDIVKQAIDENIISEKEKIRQKYEWLKSYLEKSLETGS